MFERYTEKARRVIFFARYEASQFGSPYIETEHLVLGLLREDKALTNRFLRSRGSVESIRKQVEEHTTIREKTSTSVDLPLSNESKRVLAYAAEEAERLGHKHIGTEHLLLGLLREWESFGAEILKERGVELGKVREELASTPHEAESRSPLSGGAGVEPSQDLTRAAADGLLEPVLGREDELKALIEVLSSYRNGNAVLVGKSGVGKSAIVSALAQRIASGDAPACLAEKRILIFDSNLAALGAGLRMARETEQGSPKNLGGDEVILFLGELRSLLAPGSLFLPRAPGKILRSSPLEGKIRCIATSTQNEYEQCLREAEWLNGRFRPLHVRALNETETLVILEARRLGYEKFHEVSFSYEALKLAAESSARYLPNRALPGKALELLDAAATRVKLRQSENPTEIVEVLKRIRFIEHRMDEAIKSHEFEKARFYGDEERKERENLRVLKEKYSLAGNPSPVVGPEDIEEAIARWREYPYLS
jgi:ATP-dependent Clp protease ATP-binding subunit ClpC